MDAKTNEDQQNKVEQQDQTSPERFNKDIDIILENQEKGNTPQAKGSTSRGRGKSTRGRGRGRGGKRGGTKGKVVIKREAIITKGKIRKPKKEETDEEEEIGEDNKEEGEEEEAEQSEDDKEKEIKNEGKRSGDDGRENEMKSEADEKEGEENEDTIYLGDEVEFVAENAHVDREHNRYVGELVKFFKKGNVGRYQLLQMSYEKWCDKVGSKPREIEMLGCSSEDDEQEESSTAKRKKKEKTNNKQAKAGKVMDNGAVLSHQLIDLSTYWDSKMSACFGYVLLTIFVPAWLLADKTHMSNRRRQNTSCLDIVSYVGLRVPNEWRQSFLMWSTSFNLCVQYWRTKYNREDIALRLEGHYKIVLAMKTKYHEAWDPALRYNITHRTNVWSHTLPDGKLSDVGVKNEDLAKQAITDSKANGDHRYFGNPYIVGGVMENINPWTGRYQIGWNTLSNGDEQITAVTGGRMLSHLASSSKTHHHQNTQTQSYYEGNISYGQNNYHDTGGSKEMTYGGRGRPRRGRGLVRGVGSRGGGTESILAPSPTTVVNGVTVPRFGPGAWEALKAAWRVGTNTEGATTQQNVKTGEREVPRTVREKQGKIGSEDNKDRNSQLKSSSKQDQSPNKTPRVNTRWPTRAKCDMNIEEWRRLAKEVSLEKEVEEVLRGLEEGFTQGIPEHYLGKQRWWTPDNHLSALVVKEKIMRNLHIEKAAGQIYGPFNHEEMFAKWGFFRTNPMGSVVNNDGSLRMINDLSYPVDEKEIPSVNSMVDKHNFDTSTTRNVIFSGR